MRSSSRPPRVLVVHNYLQKRISHVWRAVEEAGAQLQIVGWNDSFDNPIYPPGAAPGLAEWSAYVPIRPVGWRSRGHLWWLYPRLGRVAGRFAPDIVHVVSEPWGLLAQQGAIVARRTGAAFVLHTSAPEYGQGMVLEQLIRTLVAKRVLPRVGGFATVNRHAMDAAAAAGLRPDVPRVLAQHLVPDPALYGMARADSAGWRRRWVGDHSGPVVGFLGRVAHEKGVDLLLEAVSRLGVGYRCLVAGNGPARARLEAIAPAAVTFVGSLDEQDVAGFLASLDVLVVPTRTTATFEEAYGRVVVEAAHAGTPSIVSASGHLPDLVNETAATFPVEDVGALVARIRGLLEGRTSAVLEDSRRRVATAERPDAVAKHILGLWTQVAEDEDGSLVDQAVACRRVVAKTSR